MAIPLTKKAEKGRKGDKFIAHLTPGEIVIPRFLAEDDDFRAVLAAFFKDNDVDLEKFIVGSGKNSVNPETANIEFFTHKKIIKHFKRVFKRQVEKVLYLPKKTLAEAKRLLPKQPELPAPPPLPPPIPTPEAIDVGAQRAGAATRRRLKRRRGRAGTILTEIKPVPLGGRKTILG